MKRAILAIALLAAAVAALYGLAMSGRENAHRQHLEIGEAALASGDTPAAIEAFSVAIAMKRDAMIGYLKRGEAYRRRNELDSALRDLRRAVELDALAPRAHELLGDVNYSLKRFARAAEKYQASVDLDDRSPRMLYKLALAQYASGQPQRAAATLRRAIELDDRLPEVHYLLGLCLRDLDEPAGALASLQQAVSLAPAMLPAREALGQLYGSLDRRDDRIAQLEALKALDTTPSRDVALALAYARDGRTEYAVAALGRASERYPDYGYTYVVLGRIWLDLAESRDDAAALRKAVGALEAAAVSDNSSEAHMLLGRALLRAGEPARALQALLLAASKRPVDPLAFYYLADAAERQGDIGLARDALLDYETLEGEVSGTRRGARLAVRIADSSARLGQAAQAVVWYERAVRAGAADASVLTRLAAAQAAAGDVAAARATVVRALEIDPAHAAARDLQRRLAR